MTNLDIEWHRACPKPVALALLRWETKGVSVAYRDAAGHHYGCRDISFGIDHEACLNAWTEHAMRQKLTIEDRRGFPSFLNWMHERVGPNWCVSPRKTERLIARYGAVLTPKAYAALEAEYRAAYGALHVIGVG